MKRSLHVNHIPFLKLVWLLIPVTIFTLHALSFGAWIIDDAAISFAYARNFALGHGLVAQVGDAPVEGYSNPLWVLLLAPFFRIGFDPVVTPKLISWLLIVSAFYMVYRAFRYRAAVALALVALSLNTSFVVWCISGLENPLYVFNAALLLCALIKRRFGLAGFAVALLAMTRPDGLAYVLVLPILCLPDRWTRRDIVRFAVALALPYAAFLALRYLTFGAWLPNTAVAKGSIVLYQAEFVVLFFNLGGIIGGFVLLIGLPTLVIIAVRHRKVSVELRCLLACLLIALIVFSVLPGDWMGEARFGTLFFLFFYPSLFLLFEALFPRAANKLLFAVILANVMLFVPRSLALQSKPVTPFQSIQQISDSFTEYAHQFDVSNPSILSPDAGGILYNGTLKFIDLAGLTDATIARTLWHDSEYPDQAAFNNYILNEKRPTFVYMHGGWGRNTNLVDTPEFQRDYILVLKCSSMPSLPQDEPVYDAWLYVRRDDFTGIYPEASLRNILGNCDAF